MLATLNITGLGKAETTVREILAHIEAINQLAKELGYKGVRVSVDIEEEATR